MNDLVDFLRVLFYLIVFQIKFNLLDWLGERKLILPHFEGQSLSIGVEILVNVYYFLEVQLFKINVQSPYQKIYYIALLEFAASKRSQCFQNVADLSVKIVKTINLGQIISILLQEVNIVYYWKHFRFKSLVCYLNTGFLGQF